MERTELVAGSSELEKMELRCSSSRQFAAFPDLGCEGNGDAAAGPGLTVARFGFVRADAVREDHVAARSVICRAFRLR
jgi:hypothetical protein